MDMMPLFALYGLIWTLCLMNISFEIEHIRKILEKKVKRDGETST